MSAVDAAAPAEGWPGSAGGEAASAGRSGAVVCQTSRTITWIAPAPGMASKAATKAPKLPPI